MADLPVDDAKKNRSPLRILTEVGIGLGLLLPLVALLLPAGQNGRSSPRAQCRNQLWQLALALQVYQANHGVWPPPYTVDAAGNRLHSWRTLILPNIGQRHLYESIDLSKPWDDPANAAARETVVVFYQCPSDGRHDQPLTNYLAILGVDSIFTADPDREFTDDSGNVDDTVAIVDVPPSRAVHWMSPEDITVEELLNSAADWETQHRRGVHVAFGDTRVEFIPWDEDRDELRAVLMSSDRGEPSEPFE